MIPHHSIVIMTSESRGDSRKPADEIIEAQRREIAEICHLIADVSSGNVVESIYQDPPAEPGTVENALANTLISQLDLAPMPEAEADRVLKLNGVLAALEGAGGEDAGGMEFLAPGNTVTVRPLGDEADWRADAELVCELEQA